MWDEATKKWVNKDNDEGTETESFKPPPKLGDLMGNNSQQPNNVQLPQQQTINPMNQYLQPQPEPHQRKVENVLQQPMQTQPSNLMNEENATPSAPNMFKMQKGRSKPMMMKYSAIP